LLDSNSPIPLYFQLKSLLDEQIRLGILKPGQKIPSENELCRMYHISRTTARQALNELVRSGKLTRTQGRGTFVADLHVRKPVAQISGFTQDIKQQGMRPFSKVLQFSAIIPPIEAAKALGLKSNEAAIILKRLRGVDDKVLGMDVVYLSFSRFHEVLNHDMENQSLYRLLETEFNTVPTRSVDTIEAIPLQGELAIILEAPEGLSALHLVEYVYDQNDQIFEYCINYFRGDRYIFHVEIEKLGGSSIDGVEAKPNPANLPLEP
jgi:GntR family transcriptional regulator